MKSTLTVIVLLTISIISAQKYYFTRTAVTDTIVLEKQMSNIASKVIENYKNSDKIDSLDNLFRLEIVAKNYKESVSTLSNYRNAYADNNMAGAKCIAYEIYAMSKEIERDEKISFSQAFQKAFNIKYKSLPEKLTTKLGGVFDENIVEYKNKLIKSLDTQKDNDSIDYYSALGLCKNYLDYKIFSSIQAEAIQLLKIKDKECFIIETVELHMKKGGTLTATIVRKRGNKAPLPVILTNNIYAGQVDFSLGKRAAVYNYVGVVVNTHGKRNSNDEIDPFENESEDLYEVIDWISKQSWCNGKVGMIGGSYLGFSQWAATKKLHPALKTIVPQVSVGIGIDYPAQHNVFMSYMLQWITYVTNNKFTDEADFDNYGKWDSINTVWYKSGKSFRALDSISGKPNKIFQRWLDHPSYDKYWQKMVPYKKEFSNINIPVLTTTGYYDADQLGAMYYFKEHNKYNKNTNHYLLIGPYDHFGAQSYAPTVLRGYELDSVARLNVDDLAFSWFDYILKDGKKPELLQDKVNFQIMGTNKWKHVSDLEKMYSDKIKFYFQDCKQVKSVFEKSIKQKFTKQTIDFKDREIKDFYYSSSNKKDSISINNAVYFESETLDSDIIISGEIKGIFNVSINKKDFDTDLYLYQIKPDGRFFFLTNHFGRASYVKNKEKRHLLIPNKIETLPIENSTFVSKKIEKGSKLVLVVGGNKNPYWQINYGTGKDVSEETIADAKEPLEIKWYNDSYIEIPIYKN